jgi:hypothetical protein
MQDHQEFESAPEGTTDRPRQKGKSGLRWVPGAVPRPFG